MKNQKHPNLNITIASIGGRGANILSRLKPLQKKGVNLCAIAHSSAIFHTADIKNKIELQYNPMLAKNEIGNTKDFDGLGDKLKDVSEALESSQIVFLVGNVANPTNVLQTSQIAKIAREKSALVFYVSATPFAFEGAGKVELVEQGKELLEDVVDGLLIVESNKIIAKGGPAQEAFTQVDRVIGDMISLITELVLKFGVINVDFADLKSTVQGAGALFFNSVEGSKTDIDTLTEIMFTDSLLNTNLDKLKKALYVIYAGKDVLLDEVNAIGEKIKSHLDDQARIIFGLVEDDKLKNDIKIVFIGG